MSSRLKNSVFTFFLLILSVSGLVLDCNFNNGSNWILLGNVYTCQASVRGEGLEVTQVNGSHLAEKSNNDVIFVTFDPQANDIKYLPRNIESFFPNLRGFRFMATNFLSVSTQDLKPFPNLEYFASFTNKVEVLGGDLFKFNPKMRYVGFSNNLLKSVGYNMLIDLKELEQVDFYNNPCMNAGASNSAGIQNINQQLLTSCMNNVTTSSTIQTTTEGTTTTFTTQETTENTPEVCPIQCQEKFHSFEQRYEERIIELEKQIRELNLRPSPRP